jgi:Flp pilus assembly protein TadG
MFRKLDDQTGVALLEFSFIIILLLTFLLGIIELGLLLYNQQVVTNAGREGARFGVVCRPVDYKIHKAAIIKTVQDYAAKNIVSFGNVNFGVTPSFKSGLDYCDKFQDVLTVDVRYDYSFLFLPFAKKTFAARSSMVCE